MGHRAQGPPQHQALHAPAHPRALPRRVADGPGPALLRLEVVPRQREHFAAEAELEAGEAALALGVEAAEVEPLRAAGFQRLDAAPEQQVVRPAGAPPGAGPRPPERKTGVV